MRHTAATLLLLASVHPKVVSEMPGHSSVTITLSIYSHVLPMIRRDTDSGSHGSYLRRVRVDGHAQLGGVAVKIAVTERNERS
jgi:hypothetical protein